jgi:hypothetical protein
MQPYIEIEALASRATELREYIVSEEGSKTSLVLPLLSLLGYDVFNPKQIAAELTADIGVKKGEKVDYAIMGSGEPKLIIECKKLGDPLAVPSRSQLFRYFTALRVKFGVLTDGVVYKFYSDIDAPNIMDDVSFFEFNLLAYTQADLEFLMKFRRGCLTGQMKSLLRESKKRKLVSLIRGAVRYSLCSTEPFLGEIKEDLALSNLASVTKKELLATAQRVALEEAISLVEENLRVDNLHKALEAILEQELGKEVAQLINYRLTANSVYLESVSGNFLARVFSSGLDLRVAFNDGSSARPIRVVGDIRRYSDEIQECLSLRNIRD